MNILILLTGVFISGCLFGIAVGMCLEHNSKFKIKSLEG